LEFLEDILKRYGVAADYWPVDESGPPPGEQPDREALRNALWEEECIAPYWWGDELRAVLFPDRESQRALPPDIRLADWLAEKGELEAGLRAYEFAVLEENDPSRLCELGYLLLQRCRVDELPLCDKHFDGTSVEFPGGEKAFISSHQVDFGNPGPELPHNPPLLDVAIHAFSKAYVRCVQRFVRDMGWPGGDKWHDVSELLERTAAAEDKWHELVALDGLRAAFIEADDVDGLESVIGAYCGWVADYDQEIPGLHALANVLAKKTGATPLVSGWTEPDHESSFYDFEINFFKAQAWLRGRRKAPPSAQPELTKEGRLLLWHLRELSQQLRDQRGKTEQWGSTLHSIEQQLQSTPKPIVEASRKRLAEEYGNRWEQLPAEVQRLVAQAEFLRLTLQTVVDGDWAPVIAQYARALETLLQSKLGPRLDEVLKPKYSYSKARLEHFRNCFDSQQFAGLRGLPGADRMRDLGCPLDDFIRNYRTPAVHGAEPMSPVKADEMRRRLLGTDDQRLGLLWEISSL
jgi:hypothetical protein